MAEIPLFSSEAEQSVIGGILVSPIAFAEMQARVSASDFANPDHRVIFATMAALAARNAPLDLVTVGDALEADNAPLRYGYLAQVSLNTPSAANILHYADIVRSHAQRRHLLRLADSLAAWTREERDAGKVLAKLRDATDALEQRHSETGLKSLAEILPRVLAELDERAHRTQALLGISTGVPDLDVLLDGLVSGRLYVVAARPSMGKSVFALQCARQALMAGQSVAFFSLEMPESEVVHRLLAAEIPLDLARIQSAKMNDDQWLEVADNACRLEKVGLWIDDSSQLSIDDLQSKLRRQHRKTPFSLVVVDYIGLIDGNGDNRTLEIGSITKALKQIAKELNAPVLALSQLNRKLEERGDKRPILSDLRESGAIEQDADAVIMLYRDEMYNPESLDKGCAELLLRKQRGGKTGMVPSLFRGEHCQFLPLAGPLPSRGQDAMPKRRRGFQ